MPRRRIPIDPPKTIAAGDFLIVDAETVNAAMRTVYKFKVDKPKGGGLSAGFDIVGAALVEKKRKGRGSNARID